MSLIYHKTKQIHAVDSRRYEENKKRTEQPSDTNTKRDTNMVSGGLKGAILTGSAAL